MRTSRIRRGSDAMLDEIQPRHREHEQDQPFDTDPGASLSEIGRAHV